MAADLTLDKNLFSQPFSQVFPSEVKGCQLERLLQNEKRNAKFNHCDVWGGETV